MLVLVNWESLGLTRPMLVLVDWESLALTRPVLVLVDWESLAPTRPMLVIVGSLSYTPHASFSGQSLLHAPCYVQWGTASACPTLISVRRLLYAPC